MITLAHDYETTGVDPRTCGVVQSAIAIVDLSIDGSWEILAQEVALHHPGCPIPDGAARVHGIYDQHVADKPHFEESLAATFEQAFTEFRPEAVLGYNSNRFDNLIARRLGLPEGLVEVDLMVAAQRLMNRGVLERSRLVDAYEGLVGRPAENAHDALADVTMTLELIQPVMRLMEFDQLGQLVSWLTTTEVDVEMLMPFGKHKGMKLNTVPRRYLRWLLDKGDLQRDLEASIREVLA